MDDLRGATFIKNPMIMVPSMYTEPSRFAKVVAIGSQVRQNGDVKIGDTILCNRYPKSAQPFPWDQRRLCLVREDDLLCLVTESRT